MVKPLSFKGDKKPKKRKRTDNPAESTTADRDAQIQKGDQEPNADDDDTWVSADAPSDLAGPVMFVLPTPKPSALACDAGGKVFVIPIENIVDGNKESAEPHDVRMVWVASKIVGTESWRFKGSTGKYLSCDKIGQLSATSEAVSPLECWGVEQRTPEEGGRGNGFRLKTQRGTALTVKAAAKGAKGEEKWEVRGDADGDEAEATEVRIRMQARFKPRLKKSKEEKKLSKISRRELEDAVGRRLEEDEVRVLKRARREGDYHERLLELKVKGKHDKFG